MKPSRNTYLISRALRNFLFASVLTSAATQVAMMTDAIIVSHFVGPDALSAINISSPVITIIAAISLLLGTGASMLAAKSIGHQETERVRQIFSVAIVSVGVVGAVLSALLAVFHSPLAALICPNEQIAPYVRSYLYVMLAGGTLPLFLSYTLNAFIQSDGAPQLVTRAVVTGGVVNIVLDLLMVGVLQWGITGAAIATVLNYIVAIAMVLPRLFSASSAYGWQLPGWQLFRSILRSNVMEGTPMMIANLMLGMIVLALNAMILHALGTDGMFAWSVCLQVLLLSMVLLNGVGNALFSIGGMLVGEQDYTGLTLLVRKALTVIVGVLLIFVLFVLVWPSAMGTLFGADTPERTAYLCHVLRIFSLVLIPFAVTTVMRSIFQLLEYRLLSMLLAIGQLLIMVVVVGAFARWSAPQLWWGFPLSALLLIGVQVCTTMAIHWRHPEVSAFTLIASEEPGHSMSFSAAYSIEDLIKALADIRKFLDQNGVEYHRINPIMQVCEEMMKNVIDHTVGRVQKHTFDLHFRVTEDYVSMVMKDAGKPFNPLAKMEEMNITDYEHLGLKIVSDQKEQISYKYMFGQNILFARFTK